MELLPPAPEAGTIPLRLVGPADLGGLDAGIQALARMNGFKAGAREWLGLGDAVLAGRGGEGLDIWSLAHLPLALPPGCYRLETPVSAEEATLVAALSPR